jgi:ribosome-associated translation inhibitor RaiA
MQSPVRITFRHLEPSDALREHIEQEAAKLEEFYKPIVDCHVVVDLPNRTSQGGQPYRVRVELGVPGDRIVGGVEPGPDKTRKDAFMAVSEAFHSARRELQDYARRLRGD